MPNIPDEDLQANGVFFGAKFETLQNTFCYLKLDFVILYSFFAGYERKLFA